MALRRLIIGNWKMNGTRAMLAEARAIDRAAARFPGIAVGLAPPFTLITAMAGEASTLWVGGQDCHPLPAGAFTGDISAPALVDAGARFVILGHSERRARGGFGHGETSALVRAKAQAALASGLMAIVCVGESAAEHDAGNAKAVVARQLTESLPIPPLAEGAEDRAIGAHLTVAYEPVWAVGTGRVPEAATIATIHATIRARLVAAYGEAGRAVRILYGGSVTPANAASLLAIDEVAGALVGGASLVAGSFAAIIAAADTPASAPV